MFGEIYRETTVLVTGNTGFKGSWLTAWLLKLGAKVVGVSNSIPTEPSMFEAMNMDKRIRHVKADVRDLEAITEIISNTKPDFVFHLAARYYLQLPNRHGQQVVLRQQLLNR